MEFRITDTDVYGECPEQQGFSLDRFLHILHT